MEVSVRRRLAFFSTFMSLFMEACASQGNEGACELVQLMAVDDTTTITMSIEDTIKKGKTYYHGINISTRNPVSTWHVYRRMNEFKKLKRDVNSYYSWYKFRAGQDWLSLADNSFPPDWSEKPTRSPALATWLQEVMRHMRGTDWAQLVRDFLGPEFGEYAKDCAFSARTKNSCDASAEKDYDDYDVVLLTPPLENIFLNRCLTIRTVASTEFNIQLAKVPILGILGSNHRGKVWLLKHLFEVRLPLQSTATGLSMVYINNKRWLVAGILQEPDTFEPRGEHEPNHGHSHTFVSQLVSRISDVLIFFVSDCSWLEQQTLFALHQDLREQGRMKTPITVVHHLESSEKVDTFDKRIVTQVDAMTVGQKAAKAGTTPEFTQSFKLDRDTITTMHFGLGKEDSPAGTKYNLAVIGSISAYLDRYLNSVTKEYFPDRLKRETSVLLRSFADAIHNNGTRFGASTSFDIDVKFAKLSTKQSKLSIFLGLKDSNLMLKKAETSFSVGTPSLFKIEDAGRERMCWMVEIPGVTRQDIKHVRCGENRVDSCVEITRQPNPNGSNQKNGTVREMVKFPPGYKIQDSEPDSFMTYEDGILSVYADKL